jgi:hypothetical protein
VAVVKGGGFGPRLDEEARQEGIPHSLVLRRRRSLSTAGDRGGLVGAYADQLKFAEKPLERVEQVADVVAEMRQRMPQIVGDGLEVASTLSRPSGNTSASARISPFCLRFVTSSSDGLTLLRLTRLCSPRTCAASSRPRRSTAVHSSAVHSAIASVMVASR